ncbi:hypothetical protein ACJRW5_05170 [Pseudomonas sp. SH1-B]
MRSVEIFEAYADCESDDHGLVDAVITVVLREVKNRLCYFKTLHISTVKLVSDEDDTSGAYISEDSSWIDQEFEDAYETVKLALCDAVKTESEGSCLEYIEGKRLYLDLSSMSKDVIERMM